jgi:hypothetical protein
MHKRADQGIKIESAKALHKLLDGWGFKQKSIRVKGVTPRRTWRIETLHLEQMKRELAATRVPAVAKLPIPPSEK